MCVKAGDTMNTKQLISELKKQKEMLGHGIFDQELLERYLDASFLKKCSGKEVPTTQSLEIYGINSVNQITEKLNRIYPYETAKPNFVRAHSDHYTLYQIAKKTSKPTIIKMTKINDRSYQKTFKQEKAA